MRLRASVLPGASCGFFSKPAHLLLFDFWESRIPRDKKASAKMEKGHRWVTWSILCGNLLPATLASSLQDETAAFRLHALAEAVRHLAPMVVRLIRLLQIVHLPASGVLQAAVLPARIVSYSRL